MNCALRQDIGALHSRKINWRGRKPRVRKLR